MKNDMNRLLKIIFNYKKFIILILAIFIAIGSIYSFNYKTPLYKSTATFVLVQNSDMTEKITQGDLTVNQNLISTYSNIAKSNTVLKQVIENLNLNLSEKKLINQINVNSVKGTEVLEISVSNRDSRLAAQIANEVFDRFSVEVSKLYNLTNVHIMDYAEEVEQPYNINHVKDIAISFIFGMGASIVMVLLIYALDSTIKSEKDVETYTDLTVLSSIPLTDLKKENELITKEEPKSVVSESFKTLRTNIMYSIQNKKLKTILITSGYMGEGKSFISSNLAITFAQSGKKVIFIDTDMRKGRLQKIFDLRGKKGLSNCLSDINESKSKLNINDYINKTEVPNLYVMTAGAVPPNPSELLASENMKKLLYTLNTRFDIVICDSAPCMLVTDSVILSKIADTTVIVTSNRTTKIKNLLETEKSIKLVGGNVSGVIINKMTEIQKGYKYGYYYGHSEEIEEVNSRENKQAEDLLKKKLYLQEIPVEDEVVEEIIEETTGEVSKNKERVIIRNDKQVNENSKEIKELKSLYKVLMKNTLNILLNKEDKAESILDKVDTIKNVYRNDIEQIKKTQNEYEKELLELKSKQEQSNKAISKIKKIQKVSATEMNDFLESYEKDINNIKRKQTVAKKEVTKFKADYENEIEKINARQAEDMNIYMSEIDKMDLKQQENVAIYMNEIGKINAKQDKYNKAYMKEIAQINARQAEDMNVYMGEIDRIDAKQAEDMRTYMKEIGKVSTRQDKDKKAYMEEIAQINARQAEDMNVYMGEIDRIDAKQAEDMRTYMKEIGKVSTRQDKDKKAYMKEIAQINARQEEDMNVYMSEIDKMDAKQQESIATYMREIGKINAKQDKYNKAYMKEIAQINARQAEDMNVYMGEIDRIDTRQAEDMNVYMSEIDKMDAKQQESIAKYMKEIGKVSAKQAKDKKKYMEEIAQINARQAEDMNVYMGEIDRIDARQAEDMNVYMSEIDKMDAKQQESIAKYMKEIGKVSAKQAKDKKKYMEEMAQINARQEEDMNVYMGEIDRIDARQAEDMDIYMSEIDKLSTLQQESTDMYKKEISRIDKKQAENMEISAGELEKLSLRQDDYVNTIEEINKKQKDYVNEIKRINKDEKASKEELKIQINNIEEKLVQQTYEEQINSLKEQFIEMQKNNQNQIEKLLRKIEKLQRENVMRARENKVINTTIDTQGKLIEMQRYINSVEQQEKQNNYLASEDQELVNTATNIINDNRSSYNNSIGNAIIIKELNVERHDNRVNKYAIDYDKIKNKSKNKNKLFSFFNKKSNNNRYDYELNNYDTYYEEEDGKVISQILSGTN